MPDNKADYRRGHLTGADEAEIKKMLDKKEQIREKAGRQCLAEIVEEEFMKLLEKKAAEGNASKSSEKLCRSVIDEYFLGTETGNRPAWELSENDIREFIMQAGRLYQSNQNSMTCFMGLLQGGLNRMGEDSMLGFIPDRQLYKKYIEKVMGITRTPTRCWSLRGCALRITASRLFRMQAYLLLQYGKERDEP